MLSSAHLSWDGGSPPKKIKRENLKFGLKFSDCTSMTSGLMGISSQIFIQTTCRQLGVIMWVQFLDGLPPKIWDGEKRSNSGAISDNFRLWSRIFPDRIQKSKIGKVVDLSYVGRKKLVNFGPQKKLLTSILTHPSGHCSGARLYFGPYGVMCPQIFIRATDCRRLANAHPNWDGVPLPQIMMKI